MDSTHKKEFTISSYDLNPRGQARLTTMANFFQEMAYHHATRLGYGYEAMKERDTMWVLSRMMIRIDRYPVWKERIVIETWPSGTEKLFALRDFRVRDEAGDVIGKATTYWLILDIDSRRPIRPNAELKRFAMIVHNESVFDTLLEKIDIAGETEALDHHRVLFSDLDIMGHVNNVKYLEWCIDSAMGDQRVNREIVELEINFMHEALQGDDIQISRMLDHADNPLFVAVNRDDGKEIFRARLTWSAKEKDQAGNPS